jgi:site-specific DNA-methyltransferase (adenine-specific)
VLSKTGSLYFHIDYREVHYCKILLDEIFGRESFINEIIWAYDFGGRSKTRWPAKHDNILFYAKDPKRYTFNYEAVERIPYMAPGLVGKEKAARGKFPTDTWWHTIVGTNSKEKTGYPTQKPVGVLRRIITASSNPGDLVLDFFAGSGTVGEVCLALERRFLLVDNNPQAIAVMQARFREHQSIEWVGIDPQTVL